MNRKLLIADEQQERGSDLESYFRKLVTVERCTDGIEALVKTLRFNPDIIIASSTIPKLMGSGLFEQIRASSRAVILMITPGTTEERLDYFEAGADDVFPAHVEANEIAYKAEAWLRRLGTVPIKETQDSSILSSGPITINQYTHKVFVEGDEVNFTRKEFAILWMLLSKQAQIVSRLELLRIVWNYEEYGDDRMIDTHLNRIRRKLGEYSHIFSIKTIWGVGYMLEMVKEDRRLLKKVKA
ncbi:DNA-binding response OmpR family regulator [Paenibacillus castaneae]|uniref:response regulator transcription factor n=1 Tax=Paenibacillus castaneae TaxID=474957 RepID=UPI000C9A6FEC|nr:response regulator transcription factor [Paenibacillus castaneae]NIK76979.1 DNA-binding response OmpR family regulator [Paenibacillus castaneae]